MPNWDISAEEDLYGNEVAFDPLVDEFGNPLPGQPTDTMPQTPAQQQTPTQTQPTTGQLDQQWLDQVLPPGGARQQPQPQRQPPQRPQIVRPPPPTSPRPADPLQPAPDPPQQ
jgi:hypothetical protein